MKKLLFILLLLTSGFMFAQKHQHRTDYPEKVKWTVEGKCLYGDYAHSEKGKFKKIIRGGYSGGVRIWIIDYPTVHTKYTIRTTKNNSVITKERT